MSHLSARAHAWAGVCLWSADQVWGGDHSAVSMSLEDVDIWHRVVLDPCTHCTEPPGDGQLRWPPPVLVHCPCFLGGEARALPAASRELSSRAVLNSTAPASVRGLWQLLVLRPRLQGPGVRVWAAL